MVAITVILAAVIATFVFGLGSGVQEDATAGVDIVQDGEDVTVTWISEGNSEGLYIDGEDCGAEWTGPNVDFNLGSVGESETGKDCGPDDLTITVTGETAEGTTTVIQTFEYDGD